MNILKLSISNLRAKPLSTGLSLLLLSLGVGIVSLIFIISKQLDEKFKKNIEGIDLVVGAKGSPLQLILANVYHIDYPTGNIPYLEAQKIMRHMQVKMAIPLSYGDSYKEFRIVGSTHQYHEHFGVELAEGRLYQEEKSYEVTLGSMVAKKLGLKIGDRFYSMHGYLEDDVAHKHEDKPFIVVGIFKYSNTVIDQLILCNLESIWDIHMEEKAHADEGIDDHEAHGEEEEHDHDAHTETEEGHEGHDHSAHAHDEHNHGPIPDEEKEYTALLVQYRGSLGHAMIPRFISSQTSMMGAVPAIEVNRLFGLMGVGAEALMYLAYLIIFVSGISVFVSLFSSLKQRKYELALMRSMGASKLKLFILLISEGITLSFFGFVLGIGLSRLGLYVASNMMQNEYHYGLSGQGFLVEEGYLLAATIGIGFVAALLPAISASMTNISKTLAND